MPPQRQPHPHRRRRPRLRPQLARRRTRPRQPQSLRRPQIPPRPRRPHHQRPRPLVRHEIRHPRHRHLPPCLPPPPHRPRPGKSQMGSLPRPNSRRDTNWRRQKSRTYWQCTRAAGRSAVFPVGVNNLSGHCKFYAREYCRQDGARRLSSRHNFSEQEASRYREASLWFPLGMRFSGQLPCECHSKH